MGDIIMKKNILFVATSILQLSLSAQHQHLTPSSASPDLPIQTGVQPQPLLAQAIRLKEALAFLGSSLSPEDARHLRRLEDKRLSESTARSIQEILDPYCLAMVDINPESRVKVTRGPAKAKLVQGGWTSFLIKVRNQAGVTAKLEVESRNAAPVLFISAGQPNVKKENMLSPGQVTNRFL